MRRPLLTPARTWMLLGAVLGISLAGAWLWRSNAHYPSPRRVLMISPEPSLQTELNLGLETLIKDHFEVLAGLTVTQAPAVPTPAELRKLPADMALFRFQGWRDGQRLALTTQWTTPAKLLAGQPWNRSRQPPMEPALALDTWLAHWPMERRHRFAADLYPRQTDHFWGLLHAMAVRDDQEATEQLATTQALAEAEPMCATAWATLGDHLYRSLWVDPAKAGIGLNSRTHKAFQRAVSLVPGHPRATFLWSLMLTDTGNQDMALRILGEAVRLRPSVPDLYLGLTYAGRTSGLLAGAHSAMVRRKALLAPLPPTSYWTVETTNLYLGDWAAFEEDLQQAKAVREDASFLFYQGYLALLKGDRQAALTHMKAAEAAAGSSPFQGLSRVYRAYLDGRTAEGLAELRRIDEVRGKLRIPDGELTFKQAEAYSLLGEAGLAVDCATRAFVQGFSCARWYETSPFLEKMRSHPRWPTLRRNVRERQAVLEGSFPPASFEP
ncbi:hypothetical protein [Geothrix fuzhouensis]|uniref:hypothetical protein n=1 Tax=Geothrix fuzhouensis TaxID=2966451 RepID=UPI0021479B11|nr:hypothetical protein [Geothrix fuzhouensis]